MDKVRIGHNCAVMNETSFTHCYLRLSKQTPNAAVSHVPLCKLKYMTDSCNVIEARAGFLCWSVLNLPEMIPLIILHVFFFLCP
jgi:hypothetical protein